MPPKTSLPPIDGLFHDQCSALYAVPDHLNPYPHPPALAAMPSPAVPADASLWVPQNHWPRGSTAAPPRALAHPPQKYPAEVLKINGHQGQTAICHVVDPPPDWQTHPYPLRATTQSTSSRNYCPRDHPQRPPRYVWRDPLRALGENALTWDSWHEMRSPDLHGKNPSTAPYPVAEISPWGYS